MIIHRTTLMVGEGKFREFLGHLHQVGWVTSTSPVDTFAEDCTMEMIEKNYEDVGFNDFKDKVRIVKVKIEVFDDGHKEKN